MTTTYLLFSGSSEDGRGEPKYSGKTEDVSIAAKHYKEARISPYSTGKVMIATDTKFYTASDKDFENKKPEAFIDSEYNELDRFLETSPLPYERSKS